MSSNDRDPLAALPRSNYGAQQSANGYADARPSPNADGDDARADDPIHRGKAPKNIKSTLLLFALAVIAIVYFWSENISSKNHKKTDSAVVQTASNPELIAANLKMEADAAEAKRKAELANKESLPKPPVSEPPRDNVDSAALEATRLASEKTRQELILASTMEPDGVEIDKSASRGNKDQSSRQGSGGDRNSASGQSQILDYLKSSGSELNNTLRDSANADRAAAAELAARRDASAKAGVDSAIKNSTDRFYEKYEAKSIKGASVAEPPRPKSSLYQGTIVRVVLETAISTEAPGEFRARVTSDVLDSVNMNTVLIPRGSIILGGYMTNVAVGQNRLVAATERLILPNGRSINLIGTPPADMQGTAGLPASINNQYLKMFSGSLLVGAASLLLPKNDQNITVNVGSNGTQTGGTLFATALADIIKRVGERGQQVKPIASLEIGTDFTLMFKQDYIMQPYIRSQIE